MHIDVHTILMYIDARVCTCLLRYVLTTLDLFETPNKITVKGPKL